MGGAGGPGAGGGGAGAAPAKETPQERLKRIMAAQFNKQLNKDKAAAAQKQLQVGEGCGRGRSSRQREAQWSGMALYPMYPYVLHGVHSHCRLRRVQSCNTHTQQAPRA